MPWGHTVILEAMRLYPPVWAVGREALEDISLGPWTIRRGDQVITSQWLAHRDARYFDEPLAFRPERWLDGLEKRLPRFAYFPFGGGPRVCIGNHFALMEARLVLTTLARHARFDRTGDPPLRLVPSVTLRPRDPVNVTVIRRRAAERSAVA